MLSNEPTTSKDKIKSFRGCLTMTSEIVKVLHSILLILKIETL